MKKRFGEYVGFVSFNLLCLVVEKMKSGLGYLYTNLEGGGVLVPVGLK